MTGLTLTKLQIAEGIWTGRVTGSGAAMPQIEVIHLDRPVEGIRLVADRAEPGAWTLTVPIPPEALRDGLQTLLIRDAQSGDRLDSISILLGAPLEDDIRAELNLLRAELDLLKKAFRRHCSETAAPEQAG